LLAFEEKNRKELVIKSKKGFLGLGLRHIAITLMVFALMVGSIPAIWALVKMDFQSALPSAALLIFFVFSGVFGFFKALDPIGGDLTYIFDKTKKILFIKDQRWHTTRKREIPFQDLKGLDIEKQDGTTFSLSFALEGGKKYKFANSDKPEVLQEYAKKIADFIQISEENIS